MESILILLSLGLVTLVLYRIFIYKFNRFTRENIGLSIIGTIVSNEISQRPLSQFFILLYILLLTFLIVIMIFKK
ncbi:hypothetical protein BRE01_63600 [Brevibacillus reuszeri]|uniref:Uncharacterized protein n=1 Tax=Brevibacillus reuszeri TaxID=54915 RepID=A0A0K9YQ49_9BACL|nr:hypothetical protein [Brevibacillus reuszeri]KNB70310.1 hypothetical protein ADS79_15220 [Brevibacillus reuszeri]MED1859273.1 hypothetical protein [Brevibacillus reuszeri]GED72658.1 hypothetical protein BRE01_63600 [Brevibacillus reuszeri]